ncbi:hypothetical protein [Legionella cardiaca]|uniref:Uncharacterized protein n=1 Tax=Legionella cardiaca TaxID=1071983 RepID=A0ABY8AW55_9GAMM|nr:hypothetical protein [Legionella cardiaca]WED43951.1 hypothetical protein PXX05_03975 [Legionella cardiaca]
MQENPWAVINYLLPFEGSAGPIVLQKDILAKANGVKDRIICSQNAMVLRASYRNRVFTSYNHHVPMCYEAWDYPKEKHYIKQKKLDETKVSVSENSLFTGEVKEQEPLNVSASPQKS